MVTTDEPDRFYFPSVSVQLITTVRSDVTRLNNSSFEDEKLQDPVISKLFMQVVRFCERNISNTHTLITPFTTGGHGPL